tara:strand:+ start:11617 stop:12909 length:1293 start_codon:yes stop_codon:yes gene_type:complete
MELNLQGDDLAYANAINDYRSQLAEKQGLKAEAERQADKYHELVTGIVDPVGTELIAKPIKKYASNVAKRGLVQAVEYVNPLAKEQRLLKDAIKPNAPEGASLDEVKAAYREVRPADLSETQRAAYNRYARFTGKREIPAPSERAPQPTIRETEEPRISIRPIPETRGERDLGDSPDTFPVNQTDDEIARMSSRKLRNYALRNVAQEDATRLSQLSSSSRSRMLESAGKDIAGKPPLELGERRAIVNEYLQRAENPDLTSDSGLVDLKDMAARARAQDPDNPAFQRFTQEGTQAPAQNAQADEARAEQHDVGQNNEANATSGQDPYSTGENDGPQSAPAQEDSPPSGTAPIEEGTEAAEAGTEAAEGAEVGATLAEGAGAAAAAEGGLNIGADLLALGAGLFSLIAGNTAQEKPKEVNYNVINPSIQHGV